VILDAVVSALDPNEGPNTPVIMDDLVTLDWLGSPS
jgi:hypothetical protein